LTTKKSNHPKRTESNKVLNAMLSVFQKTINDKNTPTAEPKTNDNFSKIILSMSLSFAGRRNKTGHQP
jgi:hypothetical protein